MNRPNSPLLGIDWGTSNRRAYLFDAQGKLIRQHDDEFGILKVAGGFEVSLKELLRKLDLERADVLMSGMVGSRNGWQEAPYLSVEQPLSRLGDALMEIPTTIPGVRCRVVPGYRYVDAHGTPDVMRGEETQVFGALASGAPDGWFLLPGTHSKWVRVEDGKVRELLTFMTGELFVLLSKHGTLANVMKEHESVPAAFRAGLEAARGGAFTHMAFCCRALVVTDMMPAEHTASYLSGLLIGTEIHDIVKRTGDQMRTPVQIVGSPSLAARYQNALEIIGLSSAVWDPDDIYLAALRGLANMKGN
jgi:2-dehydro-3-deoxygalactonokinase